MLGNPGCCLARGYFRISERVKDADGDHFVVCDFHYRAFPQARYPLDDGSLPDTFLSKRVMKEKRTYLGGGGEEQKTRSSQLDFVHFGEKNQAGKPLEVREKLIKVLSHLGGFSCRFPIPL